VEGDVWVRDPGVGDRLIRNVDLSVTGWVEENFVHDVRASGVVVTNMMLSRCNGFSSS